MATSFCHKMQNIKIHYDSYMQWAHLLMVSQWDNRLLPIIEAYLEPSWKSTINYFGKSSDRTLRLDSKYASVLSPC